MIGRWTGAVDAFGLNQKAKNIFRVIMPYLAFGVFLLANFIAGKNLQPFYLYSAVITTLIVADYLSKGNPAKQLIIFSSLGIASLIIGMISTGMVSVYAFISVGLFCSTLWPCIFTLAIAGLGKYTNQASGYLIMMIMGGGFISLLQGWLASDDLLGINASYIVGVACFTFLAYFGWRAKSILKSQGIDYENNHLAH